MTTTVPLRERLAALRSKPPTVLVTDSSRGSAICTIRSLGRKGCRIIAADSDLRSLGFRSRYARECLLYPSPAVAPEDFVAALLEAARSRNIDLIIPVTDEAILPLSKARAVFEETCRLAIPEPAALEVTTNKLATLKLAARLGIPTPRTFVATTAEQAAEVAGTLGWPVVLKPAVSRYYADGARSAPATLVDGRRSSVIERLTVRYADSPERLRLHMREFEGRCPVLLQEYVPGTGVGVELLLNRGEPVMTFQHKRLREIPVNGGASAFRESVPLDRTLSDYARRLMQELDWTGLAMVEFKLGADGPKLMEINGRIWGSLPLAVASGVDFPAGLADIYLTPPLDSPTTSTAGYKVGVRAHNLQLETIWIATVLLQRRRYPFLPFPKRREAVAALWSLFDVRSRFDILSLRDPGPGLAEFARIFREFFGKLI